METERGEAKVVIRRLVKRRGGTEFHLRAAWDFGERGP